ALVIASLVVIVSPAILDRDILAVDVASLLQAAMECSDLLAQRFRRATVEEPNDFHDDDPPSLCTTNHSQAARTFVVSTVAHVQCPKKRCCEDEKGSFRSCASSFMVVGYAIAQDRWCAFRR